MSKELFWLSLCAALAVGEVVGFAGGRFGACWPVAALLALFAALVGYGWRVRGWLVAVVFLLGVALAWRVSAERLEILDAALECSSGQAFSAEARVTGKARVRQGADGTTWVSVPAEIGPVKVRAVFAAQPGETLPQVGECWQFTGWLAREPLEGRDVRMFWMKGPTTSAKRLPETWTSRCVRVLERWRDELSRRVGIGLAHDPQAAALNRAILLGERANLDPSLRAAFVSAGTIHVFAISGLHVMFIAGLFRFVLLFLGVPLRYAGAVAIPLVWLYACVVGLPPSALRAALMASVHFAAPLFWRRPNGLVSWSLTFLLVHILAPLRLFDVGSHLSFMVMLAIVAWLHWRPACASDRLNKLGVTCAAWVAGVPTTACVFGRFTPGGLLANVAVLPLAAVAITAGVAGCFISFVSTTVAGYFNNCAALATRAMADVSSLVASLPGASFDIVPWSVNMCLAWFLAWILTGWLLREHAHQKSTHAWLTTTE